LALFFPKDTIFMLPNQDLLVQQHQAALQQIAELAAELAMVKAVVVEKETVIQKMEVAQAALADANIRIAELYGELEDAYEKIARSQEIEQLNRQLTEVNQEYQAANEELYQTLDTIKEQNLMIEDKNRKITSSITYAKRIQQAILPLQQNLENYFGKNNFFILYLPKDIVSGDFYWAEKCEDKTIVAVVDCTGHGIPGAFMSLIGNQLLHEIVVQQQNSQPDQILTYLNAGVRRLLRQDFTTNRDGMEMVLLVIDKAQKQVLYAGAMSSLLYIKHEKKELQGIDKQENNAIIEIKGSKLAIGGSPETEDQIYTQHTIQIDQPTTFYLMSDGFQDQFGGEKNRKFMIRQLKEILANIYRADMAEQANILNQKIQYWRVNLEQTDDITLMGIYVDLT
jgi:serine phosphatase RsbU (regulator of sigma subunit)